ncbi:MAG: ABC transporter ATP-binding protein [Rhodobacteraceae bacterium]|nr:ABC transporter ATP-binding protein [Paracoccaceae bacterium]
MTALLAIEGLQTFFATPAGEIRAVDGIDLEVAAGECLGVVGESGSGKSMAFLSVMGLVRRPGRVVAGRILLQGEDILGLAPAARRGLRGRVIAMTMQDALTALNPALTVGEQVAETLEAHAADLPTGRAARRRAVRARVVEILGLVGLPDAGRRLGDYPHQFSGGMRQRIMIACALVCRPRILVADEPTTALDVTVQAQILDLIGDMRRELGMAVVLISHDLGVVAERCERVAVFYAGQVVETGAVRDILDRPAHPYTRGLLRSIPRLDDPGRRIEPIPGQLTPADARPGRCRFLSRCALAAPPCRADIALADLGRGHRVRCVRLRP